MKYYLLFGLLTVYFIWTLRFAIKFNKAESFFNKRQKMIHHILIWIVPILWVMILKTILQSTPGTASSKKTRDKGNFYESGIGFLGGGSQPNIN